MLAIAIAVAAAGLAASASAAPQGRVIGGHTASTSESATGPMVALVFTGMPSPAAGFFCGGVLIAPQVVVTARHCFNDNDPFLTNPATVNVVRGVGGSLTLPKNGWTGVERVKIQSIHRSAGLFAAADGRGADITVVRLATPMTGATPVAWAHPGDEAWWGGDAGRTTGVTLLGYGATIDADKTTGESASGYPTSLQEVDLPVMSASSCVAQSDRPARIAHYLCAGAGRTADPKKSGCFGDSGGPLLATDPADAGALANPAATHKLIGIVSGNDTFECADGFGQFVRIADYGTWLDGFIARSDGPPSGVQPPFFQGTKRIGTKWFYLTKPNAATVAQAKASVLFVDGHFGRWLELARLGVKGGAVDLPPTKTGKIKARVSTLDLAGDESAPSAIRTVATRKDIVRPRIRKVTVKALGSGQWQLDWTYPTDNDRVVDVLIERRRVGSKAWLFEYDYECAACWKSARTHMYARSRHWGLPGKWQFRVTAFDRADNRGIPVIATAG